MFKIFIIVIFNALLLSGCLGKDDEYGYGYSPSGNEPDPHVDLDQWDLGPVSVNDLKNITAYCNNRLGGNYATDKNGEETLSICGINGAVFWTSDFDIDCDGIRSSTCNENTDIAYQPRTHLVDSYGGYLDATKTPYLVVPSISYRFDYQSAGIKLGAAGIIIYNDQMQYVVFGDTGPEGIIGEASYAAAQNMGIDPNPTYGGSDGPVTFIVFTGSEAVLSRAEDHGEAQDIGEKLANRLLQQN